MLERIPLFPLDVVLFPGMVLPLHIFEPRYRKMVQDCVDSGTPFGMVWSEEEPVVLSPDRPLIGTTALLTEVASLPDGRFNISTVGGERFRVRRLSYEEPYLVGHVEALPARHATSPLAYRYVPLLQALLARYLALVDEIVDQEVEIDADADDPASLAYIVAIVYQCQNWRKQEILAIESVPHLLQAEVDLLRTEIPILEQILLLRDQERLPRLFGASLAVYGMN